MVSAASMMFTKKAQTVPHHPNEIVAARVYGFAFISTFLAYGIGTSMLEGYFADPDPIAAIQAGRTVFTSSIILTAIVHTLANITLSVVMFKILQPFCRFLHIGFIVLASTATAALMVGGAFLALALPLTANQPDVEQTQAGLKLLQSANFYLYQAGMTVWGVGGILMCIVLLRTKLVPTIFPLVGMAGYAIFIVGTLSEFYGSGIGVMLSLPGGLFEISLSIWLIIKGFDYRHAAKREHAA